MSTETSEALKTGNELEGDDPFALFAAWFEEAKAAEANDPNAIALATVDGDGMPNVRMVLMKGYDRDGFVFYTNTESAKGTEILASRKAAAVFHWKSLQRQVRIRGPVELVSDAEADAYFQSRPRDSRIGAWASKQSRPLEGRFALQKAVALTAAKYPIGEVPRPPYWTGFRIKPLYFELWRDRPFRLHERLVFTRDDPGAAWQQTRLYP